MYYDFFVKLKGEDVERGINFLRNHGFVGACFFEEVPKNVEGFQVFRGVELGANSLRELKSMLKLKGGGNFIVLTTNNYNLLKIVCQRGLVDAIHTEEINEVIAKFAAQTKVSLLIDFNRLLTAKDRATKFYQMERSCSIAQRKKMPIIIGSGATNYFELRALSNLLSFARILGIKKYKEPFYFPQSQIIRREKAKAEGKYIMPGVVLE